MKQHYLIVDQESSLIKKTSREFIDSKSKTAGFMFSQSHKKIPGFIIAEHEQSISHLDGKEVPIVIVTLYHGNCQCDGSHFDLQLLLPLHRAPELRQYSGNAIISFLEIDEIEHGLWPNGSRHLKKTIINVLDFLQKYFYKDLIQFQHVDLIQHSQ